MNFITQSIFTSINNQSTESTHKKLNQSTKLKQTLNQENLNEPTLHQPINNPINIRTNKQAINQIYKHSAHQSPNQPRGNGMRISPTPWQSAWPYSPQLSLLRRSSSVMQTNHAIDALWLPRRGKTKQGQRDQKRRKRRKKRFWEKVKTKKKRLWGKIK